MKISGFTIIKNAIIYDFPIVEAVRSILPICDEFIIVAGDSEDATDELLETIGSDKVRIIKTVWSTEKYKDKGQLFAYQTDLALKECVGDWCFYVQSDEVVHHDALSTIKDACEKYLNDYKVEGFLLKYIHIWADYKHYIDALHFAYPREVRIVRNLPDVHSWRDAQSFRIIENFDYQDYWQKERTRKLNCILLDAWLFHYGWSRDPRAMVGKLNAQNAVHDPNHKPVVGVDYYDYGNVNFMPVFSGEHPSVMAERIAAISWSELIRHSGARPTMKKKFALKYRILSFIENGMLGGRTIGGFKNYKIVGRFGKKP
ncbi:hypothetical protein BN938_2377 [Mucinivorans hirudinis]|uniref:Glycosyltransferase 2-like domain-containing protein n=1 Tax=Mucinivorans hirudinis TaxID=1433126 RepID=A0A060RDS2_9BACT|nr:hypothetical protein BN938_2377 [Mucinivorans hirudinis]